MDHFAKERQKRYENCINGYQKYVVKETEALKNNQKHADQRNNFFLKEVKSSWKNGISNREVVLRSLARTNVLKRDADEWIAKMEDEVMGSYENSRNPEIEDSELMNKYTEILRQYNLH